MSKRNEGSMKELETSINQEYNEIPDHEMIGKTLLMRRGDQQFFHPDTKKVVQMVKRGSKDNKLYYVVYGDRKYHGDLFLVLAENFGDEVPAKDQKTFSQLNARKWSEK